MATMQQVKLIHILTAKAGFDRATYEDILSGFGVETSKDLNARQAAQLIDLLSIEKRHARRSDFATDKQVYAAVNLWRERSRMETTAEKDKALKVFLQRKFGKTQIYDLTRKEASELIQILNNWSGGK